MHAQEIKVESSQPGAAAGYDARISGREILTPQPPAAPRLTGARIFGVRPGKPLRHRLSATGVRPLTFAVEGLPAGVSVNASTGWITGRAPVSVGDYKVTVKAINTCGWDERELVLRVGDQIALTPPMGWNSWYVHSEGVSEAAVREMADAMEAKGLCDHGWCYLNIDDCWMGTRDPGTLAIRPNAKFGDMGALARYVNSCGLKLGLYSTPWMSTYAGYIGGTADDEKGDYSAYYLPEKERQNPQQLFGRYPSSIRKGLARIGSVWLVDRDVKQFAEWGVDYVKYDWIDWTLEKTAEGWWPAETAPQRKSESVVRRVYDDVRSVDRDIVLSLSPAHQPMEDMFVPRYCNLWRLTTDIEADWHRLIAPFDLADRLARTRPGAYGDLDMLQIGPLGKPNRAETHFRPSPLTPSEQYFQVTLWSILTQPLLLSCYVPAMDDFDLNLVTNDEVLAVNQDPLCRQGRRIAHVPGRWEIWAKDLVEGAFAVGFFNLSDSDAELTLERSMLGGAVTGGLRLRDLWRQCDLAGGLEERLTVKVSAHGASLLRVSW